MRQVTGTTTAWAVTTLPLGGLSVPPRQPTADPGPGFHVLGPVSVVDGRDVAMLPHGKPTTLLAYLLLHGNEVISAERLKHVVWGRDRTANAALHTCVRRLRRMLSDRGISGQLVQSVAGGYRIEVDASRLDLIRFRELVTRARTVTEPNAQVRLLREALREWRGPLLANVDSDVLNRDELPRLTEERLAAHERAVELELQLGRCREVLAELWELTRAHPERERFAEQLIEALYRTGRQAEALAEYRGVKGHLRSELGIDPGPALQRLELAILRGDTVGPGATVEAPAEPPARTADRPAAPTRPPLPAPLLTAPCFTGRDALCQQMTALLRASATDPVTVVLSGAPGVGKTALALHVAELLRDRFPGGRLAVRMTHPDGSPRPPADLRAEVAALAPDPGSDPPRPRLLVLDDVVDAEAPRDLALRQPGDALIVTSRLSLAGLVATTHRTRVFRPGRFAAGESLEFLRRVLGADRVDREKSAAARLTALCDHYPLALRIASTRLLTRPLLSIADYVDWLARDPVHRLSLGVDNRLSATSVIGAALHRLDPAVADAFLRVGSCPAVARGSFSAADCSTALTDWATGPDEPLHLLVEAGFLEEDVPGRFHMHGLLRLYAASRAQPDPRPASSRTSSSTSNLTSKGAPR